MALNGYGLGFQVTATDQASQVFNKVGGNLGKMEKDGAAAAISLQEAGNELKSMGDRLTNFGTSIRAALLDAAQSAGVFNAGIAKAAHFTSATAAQVEQLRSAAQNADLVMKGFSFEDQAAALGSLAHEYGNVTDAINTLVPTLRFAKITGMDTANAAGVLADLIGGFGLEASDATGITDKLAYAMKQFGLKADELEGALMPTVGAARLLGASFEDTLNVVGVIATGLGNVKKSAMSVTMAMNQLADPKVQQEFNALGVAVKGTDGKFRAMIDILGDVSEKTKGMTEAQKAQALASVFGAKGAGGLNIVIDQLTNGVKDATGNIVKGAAAVEILRKQMEDSKGAAEAMAMAGIKTLPEAQKALLAAVSSLKTAIGGPVEEMLVPIVKTIAQLFARIARFFSSLTPGFKKVIVGIVAAVGVVTSFIGAVLGAAGAVAGLILAGKALLIGLAGVAAVVQVVVAMFLPLIAIAGTLYLVWTKNIGGIQERVTYWFDKIKLAFKALYEVFTSGGFSMAVFDELNKAENQGIKAFAINAFLWFNRIKNFFSKLGEAFSSGIERVSPVIEKIIGVITRLANRFSMTSDAASTNKEAFDKWGAAGAKVGDFLVRVVEGVATIILKVVSLVDGVVEVFDGIRPALSVLWDVVKEVWKAFTDLFSLMGSGSSDAQTSADTWRSFGNILGWVANGAIFALTTALRVIGGVLQWVGSIIGAVSTFFSGMAQAMLNLGAAIVAFFTGDWDKAWKYAQTAVETWAKTLLESFLKIVGGAVGMVDSLAKVFKVDLGLKDKVAGLSASITGTAAAAPPTLPAPGGSVTPGASPAVAAAAGQAASAQALAGAVAMKGDPKVEVNNRTTLVVDGQVLADVVEKKQQQNAARSFAPTPAPA